MKDHRFQERLISWVRYSCSATSRSWYVGSFALAAIEAHDQNTNACTNACIQSPANARAYARLRAYASHMTQGRNGNAKCQTERDAHLRRQ